MRHRWWNGVVLCCGMLVLPALGASLPQSTTPVAPTTHVTDRSRVNAPDIGIPLAVKRYLTRRAAGTYFADWLGTVDVGPLKAVPAPATSSGTNQ